MKKELTRFELAAVKRLAANTKTLRAKVEKINAKIADLTSQKEAVLNEINMWEAPIVEKFGFTVDQILNGEYLQECDTTEYDEITNTYEDTNVEYTDDTNTEYNTL